MSKPRSKGEKMDREQGKRKGAMPSPGATKTGSGPRANKIRKTNPPESTLLQMQSHAQGHSQNQIHTHNQSKVFTEPPAQSNERPRNTDLVQKLVTAWIGGSQGQHPLMTQEGVRESIALRDMQQQCSEAESMVQMFQQKVVDAETVIGNLKNSLKVEGKEKMDLMEKMNATGHLTATISDHINYITDALARCQQHKNHLSKLYNSVILKQKDDYTKLKNREEQLQKQTLNLQNNITNLEKQLETLRHKDEYKWKEMQRTYETELTKVREDFENTRKQLEALANEKNEMTDRLADEKKIVLDLEKKTNEYDNEVKKLTEQLSQVSSNLRSLREEKDQWEVQLTEKDRNLNKIIQELDAATVKITELSAEVTTANRVKCDFEEKIKYEVNERETLSNTLNVRIEDLKRQVDHLRNSKDEIVKEMQRSKEEAVKEMERSKERAVNDEQRSKENVVNDMQKKIEKTEREMQRILTESISQNDELVNKYERQLKAQVEKYENCIAEIKTMEARHKCELSRANQSSSATLVSVNAEKRQMERELDTLRREKEHFEVQCRQVEDLLIQHTKSEKLLQKKLDEAQSDIAKFANAAATAAAEKKRVDEDKQEKICKIQELEKELLKLQFDNAKSTPIHTSNTDTVTDMELGGKGRTKKPTIVSTQVVKKSILKRTPRVRRTRSSPPSPVITPQPPPVTPSDKKITFDLGDFSDSSPAKLLDSASVNKFINSESLFDEMIGVGKSSSQPMQASLVNSQTPLSQVSTGGRKFFKSRYSQSK